MLLLLLLVYSTPVLCAHARFPIRLGIIDDHDHPSGILNIALPNVTLCSHHGIVLQIFWINSSQPLWNLVDDLQMAENRTYIYLARSATFSTKLIQDFCQTHGIPFMAIRSYNSPTRSSNEEYVLIPDILHVLVSYLKYHRIHRVAYIYDNDQAARRVYQLLKLLNTDDYFNGFSLDLRTTQYDDIYSLLYSIEVNVVHKDQPPKYILLDLASHKDYERMFDKISHMGKSCRRA